MRARPTVFRYVLTWSLVRQIRELGDQSVGLLRAEGISGGSDHGLVRLIQFFPDAGHPENPFEFRSKSLPLLELLRPPLPRYDLRIVGI